MTLASTLLGGNGDNLPTAIALDSSGNPVVVSKTTSTNGPTTLGAYQTALTGSTNLLVSKLSSSLATLISSTYLGGSNVYVPQAVVVDGRVTLLSRAGQNRPIFQPRPELISRFSQAAATRSSLNSLRMESSSFRALTLVVSVLTKRSASVSISPGNVVVAGSGDLDQLSGN